MTSKQYKSFLIESTVSGISKMEVYKSPADKIIKSIKSGDAAEKAADSARNAEDAIAVLGRIYDAQDNDRPLISENDEEHEAQGDSEISVDLPDNDEPAKIQDIADVIDDDAGCEANPDQQDEFKNAIQDDAQDLGLDESFILEGDEETEGETDTSAANSDEGIGESVNEELDLPEDEEEEVPASDDEVCPECGEVSCVCDDEEDKLPEDEEDEPVSDDVEVEDEGCKCEGDEDLPEDEEEDELPEDDEVVEDKPEVTDVPEVELPEDEAEDIADDDEGDADEDLPEDEMTEDVDDAELATDEQTGEDALLAGGEGDEVPAEEIEKDGDVYTEGAEDPAIDPNAVAASAPVEAPVEGGEAPTANVDQTAEAPVEGDAGAVADQVPAEGEPQGGAEDPATDPNEQDPVLDIDSQVVATDTTQESVLESLIREMNNSSDEGYMSHESDDFESED